MARAPFAADVRAAAVSMLTAYAAAQTAPVLLQVYRARPRTIRPPTAFVDSMGDNISYTALNQRTTVANVIVVWGLFDSGDAVDQRDAFVDGFYDWTLDDIHSAGGNTTLAIVETDDIPAFVPEWLPPAEQRTYYATRIALEGLALEG